MLLAAVVLSAFVVACGAKSSCIIAVKTVPVPSSIENELESAEVHWPSLVTIGSIVNTFELSSPLDATVESVIEYYEVTKSSLVSEMESIYEYPSLYTDVSAVTKITAAFPTLADAVAELVSVEKTQEALASHQSELQSAEVSYSTILTALAQYIDIAYPSLYTASVKVSDATLTNPSIFASVVAVSTAVSSSLTVSEAISYLSAAAYTLPSTVVAEMITIINSPSTVADSTVRSLEECYTTLYADLSEVVAFTCQYPSLASAITGYLSAAAAVSGLGDAVEAIVSQEMPTLKYQVSVLQRADSKLPALHQDMSVLTAILAQSPSLACAEDTIEASFYASASIASSIYYALDYPSLVSDPSQLSQEEESHESLVSAIDKFISWQDYYSSSASLLHSVETQLLSVFQSYRTLLTAYDYVQDVTSPSVASATAAISAAKNVVSDLTYVLSGIAYITQAYATLSCVESNIEHYAEKYPTAAEKLWSAVAHPVPSSQVSYFNYLAGAYPSMASLFYQLESYESQFPSMASGASIESSFIYAASVDSSLLSQYTTLSYQSSVAASSFYSQASSHAMSS